jgi:hypothetical protein
MGGRFVLHFLKENSTSRNRVDCVWNVISRAQKPDFVFQRNGRVHLNRRGASVQSTTGSRVVHISGGNAGYTMFRGNVKGTGCLLHSPVSPLFPLPCVTVCHHISDAVYQHMSITICSLHKKMRTQSGCTHLFVWVSLNRSNECEMTVCEETNLSIPNPTVQPLACTVNCQCVEDSNP